MNVVNIFLNVSRFYEHSVLSDVRQVICVLMIDIQIKINRYHTSHKI